MLGCDGNAVLKSGNAVLTSGNAFLSNENDLLINSNFLQLTLAIAMTFGRASTPLEHQNRDKLVPYLRARRAYFAFVRNAKSIGVPGPRRVGLRMQGALGRESKTPPRPFPTLLECESVLALLARRAATDAALVTSARAKAGLQPGAAGSANRLDTHQTYL